MVKYKWEESNLALFGSDLEKEIKKAAAQGENEWKKLKFSRKKSQVFVWRIEKFKVVPWPKSKYGAFHEGDSYVVLHVYKKSPTSDSLLYDIFFWIGADSTADEYGTAAYKTVELDHFLNDKAIQHREVQEHESDMFLELFPNIRYLEGGIESGFRHVNINDSGEKNTILLHVKGNKRIILKEVKCRRDRLNSGDVFILDTGLNIFQWNGKESNANEKLKANAFINSILSARAGKGKAITLDEGQGDVNCKEFWNKIPGERKLLGITVKKFNVKSAEAGGDDKNITEFRKKLFRLSDRTGKLKFNICSKSSLQQNNRVSEKKLDSNDVFIFDDGFKVWVWVGKDATKQERNSGMTYALKYIKEIKDLFPFQYLVLMKEGSH
eukprot:CAMPEP_0204830210 /NCGR_PEP_ID=MMETSP1346-20131115/8399_1 /ASSEMBLY_ACC=CAM_ASM_000771 /TAXON_ID=215587 /ORGANISM="Aplanochytrium stocchinoi, Strain GSBS06" /LENGTH=380 /DNA_ID=CAMNT_0051960363 /DNA_START=101 /DNA_END=1244 /DNA_ORIENTATION=-